MRTRITIGCLLVFTGALAACGGGESADTVSRAATSDGETTRASATAADPQNPTGVGFLDWRATSQRADQLESVAPPARMDQDMPREVSATERELAAVIALYQDLLAAQAEYQGDQSRWRAEDNYARAKGSTNAAMGVRTPTPRPPDPRLKLAVTRARQAFDAEYARLSAEDKQRCDAQVAACVESARSSRGQRSR